MTYYVGLDVALRSVSACVIDDQGEIFKEAKLDSEVEPIVAWLASIRNEIEIIGLEAGALTQYLTYGFQAAGYPIVCMEARGVHAALQAMRNKTDKNDARGIAQILRTGWYRSVACSEDGATRRDMPTTDDSTRHWGNLVIDVQSRRRFGSSTAPR